MAVMLVTSMGELVIDLFTDQCPLATKNFLKLCKIKYYNNCLFHSVQKDFIVQTGDPTATGKGGDSVYKLLYGDQARFFDDEIHPTLKHDKVGIVAMASAGENANASQFYITTGAELDNLDEKHTVFGEVGKGLEALSRINEAFVDDNNRPYKNIRIKHTIILEDPFDDPAGLSDLIPDQSPELKPPAEGEEVRLEDDWVPRNETMDPEEMEKALRKEEAESRVADETMDTGPAVDGDYDVKDEELVDFEGSDYGFESGDEEASAADDEAQAPPPLPSKPSKDSVAHFNAEAKADGVVDVQPPVVPVFFVVVDDPPKHKSLRPKPDLEDGELDDAAMRDISSNYYFESAVSCRMGLSSASLPSYGNETNSAAKPTVVIENLRRRWLGLIKLLSEAEGMFKSVGGDPIYSESPKLPEGSDPEAVANGGDDDEGENDRRERKRRKDRYAAERHLDYRGRRDAEETALAHSRQFRGRSSDKMHGSQRSNYSRGSKGVNAASFQRGNSGPGIMGPGRPAVSMEYGGHMSSRSFGRGIPRPVGGMVVPGRLNQNEVNMQNHMRDSMVVQEHMLRQQQFMQMAQEQVQQVQAHAQAQGQAQVQARAQAQAQAHAHAQVQQAHAHAHAQAQVHMANYGTIRTSLSGSTMRPMMGLELIGGQLQGSHGMMHLQVQKPDSGPQVNYPRPLEGFGTRAPPSTDFAAGRISGGGLLLNQASNRDRTVSGRQPNAWAPSSAIYHEVSSMPAARGRAHGQGRGQVMNPLWAEAPVGGIPTGFPSPLGVMGHAVPVNVSPGGVVALGTPKRQGSLPIVIPHHTATNRENSNMKKADIRPQVDGTWRTNGDNRGSVHHNGTPAPYSRNDSAVWSKSSSGGQFGNKRSRENGLDRRHSSKTVTVSSVGNGMETVGNHLIQLGGPVTKSRMLSVSGFPENTSMAAVVEAFEKQGKILEFKKNDKGNAFHITFSSVAEAVSAKRSLHRTLLNGRQITVDYTVQGY